MLSQQFSKLLFFFFTFFASIYAQIEGTEGIQYTRTIIAQTAVLGGLLIASGLLLLFFGFKLYKTIVFIAGVLIGSTLTYIVLINVEPDSGYGNRETVYLLGCLAVGLLLGFLFICFVKLGLIAVGAWGGFTIALWVLSWKTDGAINSINGRIIFIVLLVLLGAILIMFFQKSVLISATSFSGAFMICYGVDLFIQRGFVDSARLFLASESKFRVLRYELTDPIYAYLVSIIFMTILGIVIQYRTTRGSTRIEK